MKVTFLFCILGISLLAYAEDQEPPQKLPTKTSVNMYRESKMAAELPWWNPTKYRNEVGYEGSAGLASVLAQNTISYSHWMTEGTAFDFFFGYSKGVDSATEGASLVTNTTATSSVSTASYTGTKNPHTFMLGAGLRTRLYQNEWFALSLGGVVAFSPGNGADYPTGTRTETTPNTASPTNKTVVETNLGTISVENKSKIAVGPRLVSEFYLKWFPHLALGLNAGIFSVFYGDTVTTTNTRSRTYAVVNGVDQTPSADSSTSSSSTNKYGMAGSTFGLGGSTFQFTGTFTLHYVW